MPPENLLGGCCVCAQPVRCFALEVADWLPCHIATTFTPPRSPTHGRATLPLKERVKPPPCPLRCESRLRRRPLPGRAHVRCSSAAPSPRSRRGRRAG